LPADKVVCGMSVLKGAGNLTARIDQRYRLLRQHLDGATEDVASPIRLLSGFHGGGYARKLPANLLTFWDDFERQTDILLDPVYTLKLFFAIFQLAESGYWPRGTRLLAVHSGGLQGRRGFGRLAHSR